MVSVSEGPFDGSKEHGTQKGTMIFILEQGLPHHHILQPRRSGSNLDGGTLFIFFDWDFPHIVEGEV